MLRWVTVAGQILSKKVDLFHDTRLSTKQALLYKMVLTQGTKPGCKQQRHSVFYEAVVM
jgi:hypothetical protein